jgi:hypothetical protein
MPITIIGIWVVMPGCPCLILGVGYLWIEQSFLGNYWVVFGVSQTLGDREGLGICISSFVESDSQRPITIIG